MGQSQSVSKKSKKGGKDKDVDADSPDLAPGTSKKTDILPHLPLIQHPLQIPSEWLAFRFFHSRPIHNRLRSRRYDNPHSGSDLRLSGASPVDVSSDQPTSLAPSPNLPNTPSSASKAISAPVDVPPSQTILSNPNGVNIPNLASITPGEPMSALNGGAAGKDKIRQLDVDDMIQRLLDVGYTGKVSKSLCLKNAEIVAICQAARKYS